MISQLFRKLFSTTTPRIIGLIYFVATIHFLFIAIFQLQETVYNYTTALYVSTIPIFASIISLFTIYSATKNYVKISALQKAALSFAIFLFFSGFASLAFFIYNIDLQVSAPPFPSIVDIFYIIASFALVITASYYIIGIQKHPTTAGKIFVFISPLFLLTVVLFYGVMFYDSTLPPITAFYVPTIILMIIFFTRFLFLWFTHEIASQLFPVSLLLIAGLLVLYIGDLLLAFAKAVNTFYVGNCNDFIFLTAFTVLSLFLIQLSSTVDSEKL